MKLNIHMQNENPDKSEPAIGYEFTHARYDAV